LRVANAAGILVAPIACASTLIVGITTLLSGYLGILTIAAGRPLRPSSPSRPIHRIAILVAAHDEETVIGRALNSFSKLDYPRDLYEVHVVADNCTDATSSIVRQMGHEIHERVAPEDPGKGPALNWLFEIVDGGRNPPDMYVIIDADTQVDPMLLKELDAVIGPDVPVAQACYMVSEFDAPDAAALRVAALACRHHIRPLGRNRIGASCGLYGNGMAFTRTVMAGRRWSGHLVEDAEFQIELLLDGHQVRYVPGARLYAEMPNSLAGATTQNERWEAGRIQLARRFTPTLARSALRSRGRTRVAYLDALFDIVVPPLSILVLVQGAAALGAAGLRLGRGRRSDRLRLAVSAISLGMLVAHLIAGLRTVDAPRSAYRALLGAPRMILWKAGLWLRVLASPGEVSWTRTERNRTQLETGS
jgi:hypothetical protein